jgi:hypothetical protein
MIRNLDGALLFFLVSPNCPVESCSFVIRWFFNAEIVFFEESVLWNTLLSVNVDQCACVF